MISYGFEVEVIGINFFYSKNDRVLYGKSFDEFGQILHKDELIVNISADGAQEREGAADYNMKAYLEFQSLRRFEASCNNYKRNASKRQKDCYVMICAFLFVAFIF